MNFNEIILKGEKNKIYMKCIWFCIIGFIELYLGLNVVVFIFSIGLVGFGDMVGGINRFFFMR